MLPLLLELLLDGEEPEIALAVFTDCQLRPPSNVGHKESNWAMQDYSYLAFSSWRM